MTDTLPPVPPIPPGGWPALVLRLERLHPEVVERTPHGSELIGVATTAVRLARVLSVGVAFRLGSVDLVAFPQQDPDNVATTWARLIRHCPAATFTPVAEPAAEPRVEAVVEVLTMDVADRVHEINISAAERPRMHEHAFDHVRAIVETEQAFGGPIGDALAPGGADAPMPPFKTVRVREESERLQRIVCARVGAEIARHAEQAAKLNMDLWVGRVRMGAPPTVGFDRNGADLYKVEVPFMFLVPGKEPVAEPGRWTGFFFATNRIDEPLPEMLSPDAGSPDRWTVARKAELIDATRKGIVSVERARHATAMSEEEWDSWVAAYDEHGPNGLTATNLRGNR